jgi:hypothetical protein
LQNVNVSALLAASGLEFDHQVSGHPAAIFHLDALCPGPLANLGGVQAVRRSATAAWTDRLRGADVYILANAYQLAESLRIDYGHLGPFGIHP